MAQIIQLDPESGLTYFELIMLSGIYCIYCPTIVALACLISVQILFGDGKFDPWRFLVLLSVQSFLLLCTAAVLIFFGQFVEKEKKGEGEVDGDREGFVSV